MLKRRKRQEPPPISGSNRRPLLPTAPGTVPGFVQIPEDARPTRMRVLAYGPEGSTEKTIDHIEEVARKLRTGVDDKKKSEDYDEEEY